MFANRPMALKNLKVVAFVQNDETNEVFQAVQVDVDAGKGVDVTPIRRRPPDVHSAARPVRGYTSEETPEPTGLPGSTRPHTFRRSPRRSSTRRVHAINGAKDAGAMEAGKAVDQDRTRSRIIDCLKKGIQVCEPGRRVPGRRIEPDVLDAAGVTPKFLGVFGQASPARAMLRRQITVRIPWSLITRSSTSGVSWPLR